MDDANEMACRELVQLVTDYLDEHLAEVDRQRFEAHLAECPDCVTIVDQFRVTIAGLGGIGRQHDVPSDARDRLIAVFRLWTGAHGSTT